MGCGWEVREETVGKVEKVRRVGRGAAGEPLTLARSEGWRSKPGPGVDYPRVTGLRILGLWMLPLQISKVCHRVSLVAQWLRICLPTQGTRVRALVWEDPTCRGATRPVSHNY